MARCVLALASACVTEAGVGGSRRTMVLEMCSMGIPIGVVAIITTTTAAQ
jgi:hypothetical protein